MKNIIYSFSTIYRVIQLPSKIVSFNYRNGKIVNRIKMPAATISALAFGGPDGDDLLVLSTRRLFENFAKTLITDGELSRNPADGQIFLVTGLNAKGSPGIRAGKFF